MIIGEDCLTLNIQRPAGLSPDAKLPVFLWIFGGAFEMSSAAASLDGIKLVNHSIAQNQPIIFVAPNYRLNSFGFLPGAQVAADPSTSVNAGLMDQRLAMEWVHNNIADFGGDPTKVTIAGESSGTLLSLLTMFHRY